MKAKEYLLQIKRLDTLIQNKLIEKTQWWEIATGITAPPSGDRVQSSSSQQKMADAVGKYIDIEAEIDRRIDELIDKKQEIIGVIEHLPIQEYDVLHKVYVQGLELDEVADMKKKSYSWITTVHGQALKKVQEILKKQEAECKRLQDF